LLENSLEHGLSNKSGEWKIILKGCLTKDFDLLLTFEDNGVGITPDRLVQIKESLKNETEKAMKSNAHIGLCNVNSRIRLKFTEDRYGINITSSYGEGTTVQVLLKAIRRDKCDGEL
jgi:two-component system sensor histidine kinase YesM